MVFLICLAVVYTFASGFSVCLVLTRRSLEASNVEIQQLRQRVLHAEAQVAEQKREYFDMVRVQGECARDLKAATRERDEFKSKYHILCDALVSFTRESVIDKQ